MLDSPQEEEVIMPPRDNSEDDLTSKTEENKAEFVTDEDSDAETAELSRLRCTSVRTEVIAEKKQRRDRRNRCADYPGLAFGSAAFGSETMMKFNIIKNELHNIMRSQLKRVDGEVSALSQRIKALDENLAKSEQYIKTATAALADAVAMEVENDEEDVNDPLSQFDAQMAILEGKLLEAKYLASKATSMSLPTSSSSQISSTPIKKSDESSSSSDNNNQVLEHDKKPAKVVAKLRRPFPINNDNPVP